VVAIAKAAAVAGNTNTNTNTNAESTEGTGTEPVSNRAGVGAVDQTATQPPVTEKRKAEEMGDGMDVDVGTGNGLAVNQEQAEAADRAVKQLKVDLD
jgi:hypothetical protein